jgi:uncharacterized protein (TIGR03437 family)
VIVTAITLFLSAYTFAQAQQTADPFVTQISASSLNSFAGDISGNGRFVVIESNGDIATEKTPTRNNADGNREIFLFDYVQRRIFQITNTTHAINSSGCTSASPTPTPTASPSPTPTPSATPLPSCLIQVDVSNNRPQISNDGRWIVFSSNAINPASFDGSANLAALQADGNQEVWLYQIPAVANDDLSSGSDVTFVDLAAGTFTQVTNTAASRTPTAGTTTLSPFVADDNREATINDDGSLVALTSTRNLAGATNNDANPEIFIYNRVSGLFAQVTNTTGNFTFSENPSLSGSGGVLAFISNANIPDTGSSTGNNSDANAEVYLATVSPSTTTVTGIRQVTRTAPSSNGSSVNVFSFGRRVSRNGNLIAFESAADLATSSAALQSSLAIYIYNVSANTFTQVGPRTAANTVPDLLRFPTFTGDNTTLVFVSALNLKADGTIAAANATDGLNPPQPNANDSRAQLWSVPVGSVTTVTRLTNNPVAVNTGFFGPPGLQGYVSNSRQRIAFSLSRTELGGGNADGSAEAFYLLTPPATPASDTSPTVSFFTGASNRPVASPSPTPTPPAVGGLAPGMLSIARSAAALAPSNKNAGSADENRRPPLPVELNGVSVSINGAAAGLYFVSAGEIRFVVPVGLAATTGTNTYPVVINNNGNLIRSTITILAAQPDIFTSTSDAGGRANATNITNSTPGTPEPFTVTTVNLSGQTVPTILQFTVTGVRNVTPSQVTVRIGTTDITGASILAVTPTTTPGMETINVQLPASLAGAGDVPVIISVTINSVTYTSRPAESAPRIQIQ